MNTNTGTNPSPRQCGASGALRCAQFAVEDATRDLEWHLREMELPRDELLAELRDLNHLRAAAVAALQPLWMLAGSLGKSGNKAPPARMMFEFDGSQYSLDSMLVTNSHDESTCNWLRTAPIGETYCGCARVS
jgi:hypothetical protein